MYPLAPPHFIRSESDGKDSSTSPPLQIFVELFFNIFLKNRFQKPTPISRPESGCKDKTTSTTSPNIFTIFFKRKF